MQPSLLNFLFPSFPFVECGCYGYNSPPPGPMSEGIFAQSLLLSNAAKLANVNCKNNAFSCVPNDVAASCNAGPQSFATPNPTVYNSKFQIISTCRYFGTRASKECLRGTIISSTYPLIHNMQGILKHGLVHPHRPFLLGKGYDECDVCISSLGPSLSPHFIFCHL